MISRTASQEYPKSAQNFDSDLVVKNISSFLRQPRNTVKQIPNVFLGANMSL